MPRNVRPHSNCTTWNDRKENRDDSRTVFSLQFFPRSLLYLLNYLLFIRKHNYDYDANLKDSVREVGADSLAIDQDETLLALFVVSILFSFCLT